MRGKGWARRGLLAIGLVTPSVASHAAATDPYAYKWEITSEEDSIPPEVDKRFSHAWQHCQDRAEGTRQNVECFSAEFTRQDAALNRVWRTTLRRWPVAKRAGLVSAQRAWAARRDPFCREEADQYSGGTIMPVIFVSCQVEVTIRRTIWLEKLR